MKHLLERTCALFCLVVAARQVTGLSVLEPLATLRDSRGNLLVARRNVMNQKDATTVEAHGNISTDNGLNTGKNAFLPMEFGRIGMESGSLLEKRYLVHTENDYGPEHRDQSQSSSVQTRNNTWLGARVLAASEAGIHRRIAVGENKVVEKNLLPRGTYSDTPARRIRDAR